MGNEGKSCPRKQDSKRMHKSKVQLEALEEFYDEYKYPSEQLKLDFANSIGLSLRQVSGWFCHRRAKDKRAINEVSFGGPKHNVSDVVHEHSTGPIQESCSSTKHENSRHFDPREVESEKICVATSSKDFSAFEKMEHRLHSTHYTSTDDDAFPESSSDSEKMHSHVFEKPCAADQLRCTSQDIDLKKMNFKDSNGKWGIEDASYLSLKDSNRDSSISLVKRKLGRLYHENGPPISVEFDPLPPGAFDTPIIEEDFYGHDLMMEPHSLTEVNKNSMVYSDRYSPEIYLRKSCHKGKGSTRTQFNKELTNHHWKLKSSVTNQTNYDQRQNPVMGMDEELSKEDYDFDDKNHESQCNYSFEERMKRPSIYSPSINDYRAQISQKEKYFDTRCFSSKQETSGIPDEKNGINQRSTPKVPT